MISQFSLWFADRDYLGEIDFNPANVLSQFSYLFIRTSHKRNNFSNHTHHSCLHQHHHSHSEKTMLIKCGRIEFVLSETTQHIYETTVIKPNSLHFGFIQITSHKKRQLIIRPFPYSSPGCSFQPSAEAAATVIRRLQGSAGLQQQCHDLAVAFLSRHQQRRQTSAHGWVPQELGKWLGSFERQSHCFALLFKNVQKCSKQV